ncbi:MAG: ABC transporter ATP-binding protein [Acidimicrobiales bacterium]
MPTSRLVRRARRAAGTTPPDTAGSGAAGWKLLVDSLRRQRRLLAKGFVSALCWTVAKVSVPLVVEAAIDHGIVGHRVSDIVVYAIVIAAIGAVQGVSAGARRYFAMSLAYEIETDLRHRLFAHVQRLHFAFHDQTQTGQLMSRSATDLQQVSDLMAVGPLTVASSVIAVGVAVILVLTNWTLALLALWPLVVLGFLVRAFALRMHPAAVSLQSVLGELSSAAEESVSGVRTVKGFGAERVVAARMTQRASDVLRRAIVTVRLRSGFAALVQLLPALGLTGVLYYGGRLVIEHQLPVGALVASCAYVTMLVAPLTNVGYVAALSGRAVAAAERVDEILSLTPVIADPPRPGPMPASGSEVRFEAVSFAYPLAGDDGSGPAVLTGLDLVIGAGESIALVGGTGSGKSTIAKLVPRFYDADQGRVTIAGVDVRTLRLSELRRAVGIVFEDTFLFSDSIRANIAFAVPDSSLEQVREAARLAGADEFIAALPDGYDTLLGERGLSLSGGQRQRISIARAVLGDPRVLILDDATSAVDAEKEREIADALRQVMSGRTTVLIAHREATIALADRVAFVERGRIAAEGTHEELLASSAAYRRVLARAEAAA